MGKGWKTRRILSTKPFTEIRAQILDMSRLANEMSYDGNETSAGLVAKMNNQFPQLKAKYAEMLHRHYIDSTWLDLLKPVSIHSPPTSPRYSEEVKLSPPPPQELEEMEIKPKKAFLRRGQ